MPADGDPGATRNDLSDALAFSVHILTASGAVAALFALLAAIEQSWSLMFWFLGAALIVDGVDGTIARRLDVAARLPRWSGEVLDLVVDFLSYVFIPAFTVVASGLLPLSVALACVTLLRDMMPGPWITAALCVIALYFLGAGLLRRADA